MCSILHIGEQIHEYISVEVINRQHPETECFWDSNWISTEIKCQFGSFQGAFSAEIRTEELFDFEEAIKKLYANFEGEAHFNTMEEQISLSLKSDKRGHIEFSGKLEDRKGNHLLFESTLDQTYLPNIIVQLKKIRTQFPILHEDKK